MANESQRVTTPRFTRRGFLGGISAGAIGAAGAIASPESVVAQQNRDTHTATRPDRFSRMFDRLPPFADASLRVQSALRDMGQKGGLLDANDLLSAGPVQLIADPALRVNNPDNPLATAGVTFLGQFLDHDMTFDASSRLGVPTRPESSVNSRTPAFDLDSVYGRGPIADTQFYDPADRVKFKIEKTTEGGFEDLPRTSSGTAIIPDPRNDEHVLIGGMQAAFLCFHNKVVDMLRAQGDDQRLSQLTVNGAEDSTIAASVDAFADFRESNRLRNVFNEARRLVTWHYQWIILNEFLPNIVGSQLVNDILQSGRRYYRPRAGEQSIPVEFQAAAYRFGHSIVRPSYRANMKGDGGQPFFAFIFDPAGEGQLDPVDLRGGARAARRFVGWQTFFDFGGDQATNVRHNKLIDTKLSTPLFDLPLGAIASGDAPTSLAQRNLLRQLTWSLPSGQDVARAMGIPPLASSELGELTAFGAGFERSTPLWYYILKEAELAGGTHLAGVGARIVAEVFIGLLQLDDDS
ncbi:MAG TPA: heme peroxidase family protein, partial [Vicinamibacterales bacterium]